MLERTKWIVRSVASFFLGWITGAAVGALTALLLAPQPGTETQEQLKRRAEALRDETDRAIDERRRRAEGKVAEARTAISERLRKGAAMLEPEG